MTEVMAVKAGPESPPVQATVTRLEHLGNHLGTIAGLCFLALFVICALIVFLGWTISEITGHGSGALADMSKLFGGGITTAVTTHQVVKQVQS